MRRTATFIIISLYCSCALFAASQQEASALQSPIVHSDRTITFNYADPRARRVRVKGSCFLKKEDNTWFGFRRRKVKMRKDASGVWTYTTTPQKPGGYQYQFFVNGKALPDPLNKDSVYSLLQYESFVAVGGDSIAEYSVEHDETRKGRLDTFYYYNAQQNITRMLLVYVPEQFTENLPTLYLLHGISGDERSWIELGRVEQILDNMLTRGEIEPMLVVLPDCNIPRKIEPKHRTNLFRNIIDFAALHRGDFEHSFMGLVDTIEAHYHAAKEPAKRAIAGVSAGSQYRQR